MVEVSCPACVKAYNIFTGGVDLCDKNFCHAPGKVRSGICVCFGSSAHSTATPLHYWVILVHMLLSLLVHILLYIAMSIDLQPSYCSAPRIIM